MEEREKVENCYYKMYCAMINKDITSLEDMLDVSFSLIHMTGMKQPKAEFLSYIEKGILNYYSAEHEDIFIEIEGDKATLIGKSLVIAAVFGGEKGRWRLQLKINMIKKDGQWRMKEAKASTY